MDFLGTDVLLNQASWFLQIFSLKIQSRTNYRMIQLLNLKLQALKQASNMAVICDSKWPKIIKSLLLLSLERVLIAK